MPLPVRLGGVTWPWQLDGDRAVGDWLSRRPWLGAGGLLIAQAPSHDEGTVDALRREIFAADARVSEVRVIVLSGPAERSLTELVGEWLCAETRREREVILSLADDLDVRPAVFVLDARPCDGVSPWADQAAAMLDMAAKLGAERLPSFVVLHGREQAPLRGSYRLDRGWPVGLARSLLDESEDSLWTRYVHLRFAWECGGVIEDGRDCAALAGDMPLRDDDELERVLNRFATVKFHLLPEGEREAWLAFASAPGRGSTDLTLFGHREVVEGRLTPVPWVARALLVLGAAQGSKLRALRTEINCRPLIEQVLNRCFAVEASLRGRLPECLPDPPADLQTRYDQYRARGAMGPYLASELYPETHPSPPRDGWDFASIGQVTSHLPSKEAAEWKLFRRVGDLRNVVAHGHYIGWRGLREARAIRTLLA